MRADIDPRLSEQKVPGRAILRDGFRRRRDEDLLRAAAVMMKTLQCLGAEILFEALERHRQRGQDGNAQFLCGVRAQQISPLGKRGEHHELRMRAEFLQLFQFRPHGGGYGRPVLFADRPVGRYPHDDRNTFICFHWPSISKSK